jgi:predicted nucleic acid-binding protein
VRLLADSSVWIDHLRKPDQLLAHALRRRQVVVHPFVLGEIALGSIADRAGVLAALTSLRRVRKAEDGEVLALVERHGLHGTGLGWVDAHLLAGTLLTPETRLWTRDRRLHAAAERLGVAVEV